MSTRKIITNSAKETQEMAAKFAGQILRKNPGNTAMVLALQGDLGSGKTTFLQGFAKGLGIKEKILSPTFVILKRFKIPPKSKISNNRRPSIIRDMYFYHIDCYRLNSSREILDLGFKEIISNPQNIVAIEWPERIKSILPRSTILIKFKHLDKNNRNIDIYTQLD